MGLLVAFPSGDPIRDYNSYDFEKERQLLMRPKCTLCDKHIQDDYCYIIQGNCICDKCMSIFRVSTEEVMEDDF